MINIEQKSSEFLLECVTLVSLVNIVGSGKVFILAGKSHMYSILFMD
jgi:hypothetical protein